MQRLVLSLLALFIMFPAAAAAQLAEEPPKVTIDIAHPAFAVKGEDLPLIITQNIIPNWHTYWVNPGDSGEEMKLKWELPAGVGAQDIDWPMPQRVPYGPLINYGYKGTVDFLTHLTIPVDFEGDRLQASARVGWLVCEEICIPERTNITIDIPVLTAEEAANSSGADQAFEMRLFDLHGKLPEAVDWAATFEAAPYALEPEKEAAKITTTIPAEMITTITDDADNLRFFPYDYGLVTHPKPVQIAVIKGQDESRLAITAPRSDMPLDSFEQFKYLLDIDGKGYIVTAKPAANAASVADDTGAMMDDAGDITPNERGIENAINDGIADGSDNIERGMNDGTDADMDSTAMEADADTTPDTQANAAQPSLSAAEKALFHMIKAIIPAHWDPYFTAFMFFAFLGGLILNLMPCVFPVLSMKALSVVKLADYSILRLWGNGLFYTFGVLISFGAIAATLLLLRSAGHNIGWGFQLQNPNVVIILSWLIFAVGLNLSGMFNVSLGKAENAGSTLATQPGISGAFFTGMLATLVATPCTAAFMGTALGAAVILPTTQAMAIFLMLGFGLAFPYLLICLAPPLVRMLPRPGSWMETFRQFLAFPMYGTAIWLVWVAVRQTGDIGLLYALGGMLVLGFGVWLLRHSKDELGDRRPILTLMALIFMILPLIGLAFLGKLGGLQPQTNIDASAAPTAAATIDQVSFDQQELDRLLSETDRPVFVNMTASWCVTCLLNERTSLSSDSVKQWMADHDVVYMKGDWTNYDDHITDYLRGFGRSGVPIYVFYGAPDENGTRPDAQVLPQILTPARVTGMIPS